MNSYLEQTDEKLALQLTNFTSKIDTYNVAFGITAAEVTSIKADGVYLAWSVTNFKKIETYKKNWTTFKNILKKGESNVTSNTAPPAPVLDATPPVVPPGVVTRFTTMVNRIKAHQSYTTAIGQNLGIEMTNTQKVNLDSAQPTLKTVMRGGQVNLLWKKGKFGGILIEKDSGAGFVTLDKDFHPDFIDNSTMPAQGQSAVWKYRAIYLLNDEKVGLWSDVVTVSVTS
ncbi:hypothetical protein [Flavobacterium restrictum]|uniref:Uncharacterized protein n=1 Tax=Flavobacterium restrictum TaxID=2594428 RepID=A0A553DRA5_9FLAO|nr:hypothetical protein [Flavobacterium restrictum]TRX35233.1 hypothetical protein FNW21_15345 [Flavobacterium restrictum]